MHRVRHRAHRGLGHAARGRKPRHRTTRVPQQWCPMNSRYRIRFSKLGKIRFTSHRDVARMWERGLRRATLPVAYTEGFSPHPKLSFGLALSTGHESLGEYLDIDMAEPVDVEGIPTRLDPCLPIGLDVQAAAEIEPG